MIIIKERGRTSEKCLSCETEVAMCHTGHIVVEDANSYFKYSSFIGERFTEDVLHVNHCGKYNGM